MQIKKTKINSIPTAAKISTTLPSLPTKVYPKIPYVCGYAADTEDSDSEDEDTKEYPYVYTYEPYTYTYDHLTDGSHERNLARHFSKRDFTFYEDPDQDSVSNQKNDQVYKQHLKDFEPIYQQHLKDFEPRYQESLKEIKRKFEQHEIEFAPIYAAAVKEINRKYAQLLKDLDHDKKK